MHPFQLVFDRAKEIVRSAPVYPRDPATGHVYTNVKLGVIEKFEEFTKDLTVRQELWGLFHPSNKLSMKVLNDEHVKQLYQLYLQHDDTFELSDIVGYVCIVLKEVLLDYR
jgi:hypothetical protein